MSKNSTTSMEQNKFFLFVKHRTEQAPLFYSTAYYQNLYNRFGLGKWFLSWNWPVFLLSIFRLEYCWFFYRRMYLSGILMILLQMQAAGFLMLYWGNATQSDFSLGIGIIGFQIYKMVSSLLIGVFSNALYFKFIQRKIKHLPDDHVGGPSWTGPFLFMLFQAILVFFLLRMISNDPESLVMLKKMVKIIKGK